MTKRLLIVAVLSLLFSVVAYAQEEHQDPFPDSYTDCGEISPDWGCYSAGTTDPCVKSTSYATCVKRCDCQYEQNKKKCKNGWACLELAKSEMEACKGNCITDWA